MNKYLQKQRCMFIVPSLKRAGAETQLVSLVNHLDDVLFEKHLVVLENNLDQLDKVNLDVIKLHPLSKKSKLDYKVILKLAFLIDKHNIDVIHATMQYSVLFAWIARSLSNHKPCVIAAIHTTQNIGIKDELYDRILYRPVLRKCSQVIFVCHNQRSFWLKKYPELCHNSQVIYNGVDADLYCRKKNIEKGIELKGKYFIPDDAFIISCIAGFRPEKGHSILLNCFASIKHKNSWLILAGNGPLKTQSEKLADDLNIKEKVIFVGNIADVRPILAITDVMVLASITETFSIAMLEAMSMQVPVIASNVGGLSEAIVNGQTGELVIPDNKDDLLRAFDKYIFDSDRNTMASKCREKIIGSFTIKMMIENTTAVLINNKKIEKT